MIACINVTSKCAANPCYYGSSHMWLQRYIDTTCSAKWVIVFPVSQTIAHTHTHIQKRRPQWQAFAFMERKKKNSFFHFEAGCFCALTLFVSNNIVCIIVVVLNTQTHTHTDGRRNEWNLCMKQKWQSNVCGTWRQYEKGDEEKDTAIATNCTGSCRIEQQIDDHVDSVLICSFPEELCCQWLYSKVENVHWRGE